VDDSHFLHSRNVKRDSSDPALEAIEALPRFSPELIELLSQLAEPRLRAPISRSGLPLKSMSNRSRLLSSTALLKAAHERRSFLYFHARL